MENSVNLYCELKILAMPPPYRIVYKTCTFCDEAILFVILHSLIMSIKRYSINTFPLLRFYSCCYCECEMSAMISHIQYLYCIVLCVSGYVCVCGYYLSTHSMVE